MSRDWEHLHLERRGQIALLTLDRPPVNALNRRLLDQLDGAVAAMAAETDLRAAVLAGAGRAFVAGADIAEMSAMSPVEAEAFSARGQAVLCRLEALPFPTIAAVGGYALGGGCELAMACDLVLASPKAVFGQPEVGLGLIPGFGGSQRLPRLVGVQRARELCLTGRKVRAEEAVAIGLALRVVQGDLLEEAMRLAASIAANGPQAVRLVRSALRAASPPLQPGLARERTLFGLGFATADHSEGIDAFLSKRTPSFTGR